MKRLTFTLVLLGLLSIAAYCSAEAQTIRVYLKVDAPPTLYSSFVKRLSREITAQRDIQIVNSEVAADLLLQAIVHEFTTNNGEKTYVTFSTIFSVRGENGWYLGDFALTTNLPSREFPAETIVVADKFREKTIGPYRKELARK
jgi:hypothetical protein